MTRLTTQLLIYGALAIAMPSTLFAQGPNTTTAAPGQNSATESTIEGTVISTSRSTLLIRTPSGQPKLFVLDTETARPPQIPVGATVSVTSKPSSDPAAPTAVSVKVIAVLAAGEKPPTSPSDEPISPALYKLERDLARQTRKYHLGVRGGVGLDPELVMIGAQGEFGPFAGGRLAARPSIELGFGEVTDFVAVNLEGIFRMPFADRQNWAFYGGAGIGLNFTKLGFAVQTAEENINFDDFEFDTGLNIVAGGIARNGVFMEVRAAAYSRPTIQLVVGYSF
jgi:hypothetical protein